MGDSRWSPSDWTAYSSVNFVGKHVDEIYHRKTLSNDLDPRNIKMRESRDSANNPNSNALIVGVDVTGSMNPVLDNLAKKVLNTVISEIYNRKPISDPHMMLMAIGDTNFDRSPLQVTQFEADIRLAEQLQKIHFERGGGGNNFESYTFAWLFAALRTSIDCFEKRGKKGYLFTVGDEEPTPILKKHHIEQFMDEHVVDDLTANQLLTMVSRQYEVFHIMKKEGDHFQRRGDVVKEKWQQLLGQRAIVLENHQDLAEVIVSTIQLNEGETLDKIVSSWDGNTALVVNSALKDLTSNKGFGESLVVL